MSGMERRRTGGGLVSPRILIVDDDEEFRASLERTLRGLGYRTQSAAGAREAYAALGRARPDAILLDLQMPEINGHALLRVLDREGIGIPVIVISGTGSMDDVIQVFRRRASDYLRKPFHAEQLGAALDRVLGTRGVGTAPGRGERTTAGTAPVSQTPGGSPGAKEAKAARPSKAGSPAKATPPSKAGSPAEATPSVASVLRDVRESRRQMPSLSPLGSQVNQFFHSPPENIDEVVALLSQDAAVCGGVLSAANATRYAANRPLRTVREAVIRLGTKRACGFAHELLLREAFTLDSEAWGAISEAMWKSGAVCADGARGIARLLGRPHPDEAHLGGVLHNVGELVIIRLLAEEDALKDPSPDQITEFAAQIRRHHEAAGQMLLASWNVQAQMVRLAGRHHPPLSGPEPTDDALLRQVVFLAWSMTVRAGHAYLPDQEVDDVEPLVLALRLEMADVEKLFGGPGDGEA